MIDNKHYEKTAQLSDLNFIVHKCQSRSCDFHQLTFIYTQTLFNCIIQFINVTVIGFPISVKCGYLNPLPVAVNSA